MENVTATTATPTMVSPLTYTAPTSQTPTTTHPKDMMQQEATQKDKNVDMQQLTQELNEIAQKEQLDISFGYNEKIDRVVINVTDKNTGEVIRKLPSEDAVKFAEGMKEMLGKLFDRKG